MQPTSVDESEQESAPRLMTFVSSAEGLQLNTAFARIECEETRKRIVDLVKTLSAPLP